MRISFVLVLIHPRTRLVYFYFVRVNFLVKTSTSGRRDHVRLPWQGYTCQSKYGCFCLSPQLTYLHTKIEGGLKFFISNFASLSRRIALNNLKSIKNGYARPKTKGTQKYNTFVQILANIFGINKLKWPRCLSLLKKILNLEEVFKNCLLYTSPSPRDGLLSRMPSSA